MNEIYKQLNPYCTKTTCHKDNLKRNKTKNKNEPKRYQWGKKRKLKTSPAALFND